MPSKEKGVGTLYLVGTPIGNLEDITLRALRVLREVGLIAAEDTRTTRKLLARYEIATPVTSYFTQNRRSKLPYLLQALAQKDVALVSEAGTPGVSDPGRELVAVAAENGFPVVSIPGPSAVTAAVAVSGFADARGFLFAGFLPSRAGERRRALGLLARDVPGGFSLVFLEAPHRLRVTLPDMRQALGDRRVVVCREMTKLHEEVFRGTLQEALAHFHAPRGEFTLVVEGVAEKGPHDTAATGATEADARQLLARLREQGLSARDAVAQASTLTGMHRRDLYRLWLEGQRG
ncbi:MAG: 16S rRNA (cytidine(1402)-2'-O)-methyltransferase [Dehalococcoidia bacterium]|nr:16S rRNA (cytidine(1402)-2'-O)-methyltransferase [Dehalococcoidia bacterium]